MNVYTLVNIKKHSAQHQDNAGPPCQVSFSKAFQFWNLRPVISNSGDFHLLETLETEMLETNLHFWQMKVWLFSVQTCPNASEHWLD